MAFFLRPLQPGILPWDAFRISRGEQVLRVGRAEDNEIRVDHSSVSSLHARIEVNGEAEMAVIDCGSSNGTFVNGIRVDRHRLADGDLLRFATAEFRVHASGNGSHGPAGAEDGALAEHSEEPAKEFAAVEGTPPGGAPSGGAPPGGTPPGGTPPGPLTETGSGPVPDAFAGERESFEREIARLIGELARAREETGRMQGEFDRRDADAVLLDGRVRSLDEEVRRCRRELEDAARREERLQGSLSEARRETMDREGALAALRYELTTKEGQRRQIDEERARLQKVCDDYALAWDELQARLASTIGELESARESESETLRQGRVLLERTAAFGSRLLSDWRGWLHGGEEAGLSAEEGADMIFSRLEETAARIRGELDRIEPVWFEFGGRVQDELETRCGALLAEANVLSGEVSKRRAELAEVEADLTSLREQLDAEVRRAQGLSRRGIEVEIPERFEAMVIARDREQETFRALVERLEALDRLLQGYRRSRKLRDVHRELAEFRERLAAILEAGGVRPFAIETGTFLTPRHRREVQILGRKGWGTRQYSEQPFQPGEVTEVVRVGYRIGEGDGAAVLRKVEVLIRGVED